MKIGAYVRNLLEPIPILGLVARLLSQFIRRIRGRGPTIHAALQPIAYRNWIQTTENRSLPPNALSGTSLAEHRDRPVLSFLMSSITTEFASVAETITALRAQSDPRWELCITLSGLSIPATQFIERLKSDRLDDPRVKFIVSHEQNNRPTALNTALSQALGEFTAVLNPCDTLPTHATAWIIDTVRKNPDAAIIYTDEDRVTGTNRRCQPFFKPDFDAVLLITQNYFGRLTAYRRSLIKSLEGFRSEHEGAEEYDLALRCINVVQRSNVIHVPKILCHSRLLPETRHLFNPTSPAQELSNPKAHCIAAQAHLQATDSCATASPAIEAPGCLRICYSIPSPPPLVSIVICTRDNKDLLQKAIDSIHHKTSYPQYEIVVVDNGSLCQLTISYLSTLNSTTNVSVLRNDCPFNYSYLNNFGAEQSRGDLICFLNDDIEALTTNWLTEMVMFGARREVGAVGARLWYPNDQIQHGGVIFGIGPVADHANIGLPRGNPGYFGSAALQREFSAVTGACLLTRRTVFEEIGGFDDNLAVDFNDIDLCLRIGKAGYSVIWTPYAELIHKESASRGKHDTPEKLSRLEKDMHFLKHRWGNMLNTDRYYNCNLSMRSPNFAIPAGKEVRGRM